MVLRAAILAVVGDLADRGLDLRKQAGEVAKLDIVTGTFDGTALGMTEHHDQFGA